MGGLIDHELLVADAAAWRTWLRHNHAVSDGVWLVIAKKDAAAPTRLLVTESLDEALCHGWIDGTRRRRDDVTFPQRYSPRRSRSTWSKRNIDHVTRLEAEGRMQPAGRAEIERAKTDGRWEAAYGGSADMVAPDDLLATLERQPGAKAMYEILTAQNRFAIRITGAKRPETRARRIEKYVDLLARGETIYPQRRTLDR